MGGGDAGAHTPSQVGDIMLDPVPFQVVFPSELFAANQFGPLIDC